MGRIDQATVQKILDTADIVEVVSDFVKLKKRGSGYVGLCPFHNERTPSFSVSKVKGMCKCFSCGEGGSPVNFIMKIEQLSYPEALRYLAKKYNIEIEEHEFSEAERQQITDRESLLAINDFSMRYFEDVMANTQDGRAIGLSYFRERGINDLMIKKFHLGYSLETRDALYKAAIVKGYNEKYLQESGLCYKNDRGEWYDKFRGRVIYPIFSISGRIIGFGARTLRKDKDVAKYMNSPDSIIYHKKSELFGLYQAKSAIVKLDKCILVEGYMDVISMHQRGVENVVASSGTALTEGQIRLIHRFTENVTVIYDSDAAGIKASLRGIDLLLAEGMNVKVLLLPDGDDPDSFAQSHSSSEVEEYISQNETDFIRFKTRILLDGVGNDPIARSRVVSDIVMSISRIPNEITRTIYIGECSRMLGIDEKILTLQVAKYVASLAEKAAMERQRQKNRRDAGLSETESPEEIPVLEDDHKAVDPIDDNEAARRKFLAPYECEILRYAVKYGMSYLCDMAIDDAGNTRPLNVLEYIDMELKADSIEFSNPDYAIILQAALEAAHNNWEADLARRTETLAEQRSKALSDGEDEIRRTATDIKSIDSLERTLLQRVDQDYEAELSDFAASYIGRILASSPDDQVRTVTTRLISEKHQLSRIHTKFAKIRTEQDRLAEIVPFALYNLKEALIECQIRDITSQIGELYSNPDPDFGKIRVLMGRNNELNDIKKTLAKYLGERILSPRKP